MANTLHRTLGIAVLAVFVLTSVPAPAYAQVAENLSRGQVLERGKQMPKRGKMVREMEMERPEMLNVERGNMPSKFKQKSDMAVVDSNETGGDYVEGEVLVKFKNSNINLKSFRGKIGAKAFANRKNLKMRDEIKSANIAVMTPDDGETVQQLVDRLKNDPSVEHVQPNYIYYPYAISANDTYKDLLWGLDNTGQSVNGTSGTSGADIEAQKAWNISEGSSSVVVAVIDSGVNYNHPDLAANMWDGSSCKDDSGNVLGGCNHGYDYEDDDITPLPTSSSHGTHIAGTIAAVKNNSRGVIGVVPNTKVMAIKTALTSGKLVKSINFAQQNGADIINASWGGSSSDAALNSAIDSFSGLFIAAAGNATINHSVTADYPCDHTAANIICVAATDQDDDIADFSDYGATSVDVGAPGKNIYSTIASDKVLDETFESVTPPAVPAGWTATGDWGTYNLGGSVGNVLYGDFTPPPYASDANYTITLPSINLSGSDGATLSFYTQCDTEYDSINWNDYMVLEISNDGSAFTTGFAWDEYSIDDDLDDSNIAGYYFDELSLPNSYLQSAFTIRFRWVSDSDADTGTIGDGCFIDNIKINKYSGSASDVYDYMQGTSMAAPHVAGLAALIKGYNSGLSNAEIKSNILATGDSLAALSGKTVSGKRINAYNALAAADGTPPVITLTGDATVDITVGDAYTDAGATATDDVDGDISGSIVTVNPVNTAIADTYTVTYDVSDAAANEAVTVTRTVNVNAVPVPDTTPPVITLIGSAIVDINVGDVYLDEGATATDDVDGDISDDIVTVNPVNTAIAATYTVTYNVSDAAGNSATEVTRTVNVNAVPVPDTTPPVITLLGSSPVDINVGDAYVDAGATASDNVDGDITGNIITVNPVNTAVAATYTVTYNVSDAAGNSATEVTRTVNVHDVPVPDTTPPVITLLGDSEVDVNIGETYTDAGATAMDNVDGDISANIVVVNPVDTSVVGTYTVTYNVSDTAGNPADEVTRTVNVVIPDTTPPVITLIGSPVGSLRIGDTYRDPGVTAFDNRDGDITANVVTVNPINSSVAAIYTITYNVSDAAGNAADQVIRTITYYPTDYQPPSDDPDPTPTPTPSSTEEISLTGLSNPDSTKGNGSSRGSGVSMFRQITSFAAKWRGIGTVAPGAFGGTNTTPLSTKEIEYICSIQRSIKEDSEPELFDFVAGEMAGLMSRDIEFIQEKLEDTSFCESTNMAVRPQKRVKEEQIVQFPVDENGYPVSSNPVWNSCIKGKVSRAQIRYNADRDDARDGGKPKTCADYHSKNIWRHPDFNIEFTFVRPIKKIILPEGYAVLQELEVALGE